MERNELTTSAGPAITEDALPDGQAVIEHDGWTTALIGFAFFILTVLIAHDHVFVTLVKMWSTSSAFHHGFLVAPLSVWMIAANTRRTQTQPRPYMPAALIFVLANLAWLAGVAASVQLVEQLSFVAMLIAGFVGVFGKSLGKENAFPLGFLFFMVPFGSLLLAPMQTMAAEVVVALLNIVGTGARLDGVMITTAAGRFEVAEACAGLQFLMAAIMAAALVAHLAFENWRKKILFIAGAIVIGIIANWVRAFVIVLIATKSDMAFGTGNEHFIMGWVFYGVLMIALVGMGKKFADKVIPTQQYPSPTNNPSYGSKPASLFLMATALVLSSTIIYGRLVVEATPAVSTPGVLPFFNAPGWRLSAPSTNWRPAFAHADRVVHASYISEAEQVFVSNAYFKYDRKGGEIGGYDSEAGQFGEWRRVRTIKATVMSEGRVETTRVHVLEHPSGVRIAATRLFWLGGAQYNSPMKLKADLASQKLRGVKNPGGVIYLAAPIKHSETAAINDIRSFLLYREPLSEWRDRISDRSNS